MNTEDYSHQHYTQQPQLEISKMSLNSHILKYGKELKLNKFQLKAIMQMNFTILSERIQNPAPPFKNIPYIQCEEFM